MKITRHRTTFLSRIKIDYQYSSAKRDATPSEWEASPLKHVMLPCGRTVKALEI